MKQYNVTGMSCAACSARVEKAVNGVPGVTACSVSLLTNSMGVEGTADEKSIIAAVEAAGYGASLKGADVLLTGEIKHHEILDANKLGIAIIDAGHFKTEDIVITPFTEKLNEKFTEIEFIRSEKCDDKMKYL